MEAGLLTTNGSRGLFWDDESDLKVDSGDSCTTKKKRTNELYVLKR